MATDRKIVVEFDKDLVGDVQYFDPVEYESADKRISVDSSKAFGSSEYSSSYTYGYAFDDSTSTSWRSSSITMPQYIGICLNGPTAIFKMLVYIPSYYPKDYTVQASNDNVTYDDICNGMFSNTNTGYQHIITNCTDKYQYWRINITSVYGSTLAINDIALYEAVKKVNAKAFTVQSKEYDYVPEGTLIEKTYKIRSVEKVKYKETLNLNSAEMTNMLSLNNTLTLKDG